MIKCTGSCSSCRRCNHAEHVDEANNRKTKLFVFPKDFTAATGAGKGVAFDIGTTTVAGMLWDMQGEKLLAAYAVTNPQNEYGMDVISRIAYCGKSSEKLKKLRDKIIECLNGLIKKMCSEAGCSIDEIIRVAICGNTTMSHIVAGFSPESLAVAPFAPAYSGMLQIKAIEAGLEVAPAADMLLLPNIAGHVGGDITAGVVAARVLEQESLTLFIDIGTNGEMVLSDGSTAYACSTAAGPAFEGASIEYGMRAARGAIEKVWIENGNVFFRTIGEAKAQGICGSGLIDAIAQMLDAGLINKKGRLVSAETAAKNGLPEGLTARLTDLDGKRAFVLAAGEAGENIVVTQNDIREVQLAKGAVAAGISIMLDRVGKNVEDLDRIIVAGAFGSYIDKASAVRIGLLPQVALSKIASAGNAAGAGVLMALASEAELRAAELLPQKIRHIDLAAEESFQKTYMKNMLFD